MPVLLIPESVAVITFEQSPSDTTVLEGGTATFTCIPRENGSLIYVWWIVNLLYGPGAGPTVLPVDAPGASEVVLSTDRTELRINGVQRTLNGNLVRCTGHSDFSGLWATARSVRISVQCEFILEFNISVNEFVLEFACLCI